MIGSNILVHMIVFPVLAGLVCLAMPARLRGLTKAIAFVVTLLTFILSIYVFNTKPVSCYLPNTADPLLLADVLSAFIGIGLSFFGLLITIYSFGFVEEYIGRFFGYILITLGAAIGAAFSNNLIALLVFWGILAATLYLLVSLKGTRGAQNAAKKALIIIGGTDALMLFGITLMWSLTGSFAMNKMHIELNGPIAVVSYLCIAIASFAKAGVIPFHSWLPDVAEDGPTPVTAYLPASLDKLLGIYLLARASLNLFAMNYAMNLFLLITGSVTIVLAVVLALVQHDFKRLLGYHAISQVGYMVLGIGTANPIGIAGALFHMLNNSIYKSCLFLSGGDVEKRTGITDLAKLGGLGKYMPITFASFLIASLSISGIPPFNGFVSKWLIYQGIIESAKSNDPLWAVWLSCAMFGSALTLASFMKLIHAIFLGRPARNFGYVKEAGPFMSFPVATLAVICIVFGIFAFGLPLSIFIIPSVGGQIQYLGFWTPGIATILIAVGAVIGVIVYYTFKMKKFRTVGTFIGGEEPSSLERVSGTEFYDTIKDLGGFRAIYRKDDARQLDIYYLGRKSVLFFTRFFQYLHNGILPTYMVWCLLGMAAMLIFMFFR